MACLIYCILQIVQGGKVSRCPKLNCNSLENICGWIQSCMAKAYHIARLFHWKSFAVTDRSAKTAKLFHLERFAIYGIHPKA